MTLDAAICGQTAPADSRQPCAPDPRIARAEMWFCTLRGLVKIGMWLARALTLESGGKARDLKWHGPRIAFPFGFDPITAFLRVSRAVRLALMLQIRIDEEIAEMRAGRFPSPTPAATGVGELPEAGAEAARLADKIREIGLETMGQEIESPERAESLITDPSERRGDEREDPEFYRLLKGPLKDAVAAICADLGLRPDWTQWTEDGFPPPPGGEVTAWAIFLAPESDTRPVRSSDERAPLSPTTDVGDCDGDIVWRPSWRRRKRDTAPAHSGGATQASEMARSP
jgi:hypothetical protein